MKRLGYANLGRYGLLLTPDDRIMTTRPAVLDDGLGGRIVGWTDADLATMELEKWAPTLVAPRVSKVAALPPVPSNHEPVRPAPTQAVATRVASVPAPMRHPFVAVIPAIPTPSFAKAVAAPIAVERDLTEDEWEWEIAVARARASTEETELVARAIPARQPVVAIVPPRRTRLETLPPPVAVTPATKFVSSHPRTLPGVAPMVVAKRDSWIAAEARMAELETTRVDVVVAPAPTSIKAVPIPTPIHALPRASSPHTIIPIPKLPTLAGARLIDPNSNWIQPVVRRAMPTPIPPREPRRFAKGTGPIMPETVSAIPDQAQATQAFSVDDQTMPNLSIAATAIPRITRQATRS